MLALGYNPLEKCTAYYDNFEKLESHWMIRKDGVAEIKVRDSKLELSMGPTEALYYSNAEISDGVFDDLPWCRKDFEARIRLLGNHYGSAGWGFWNHSMRVELSTPIWFIYLRASSRNYPLNGFFVQLGNVFTPIKYFVNPLFIFRILMRAFNRFMPIKFTSLNPVMPNFDIENWHVYRIRWKDKEVEFSIDDKIVSRIGFEKEMKFRADIWIDNAVFSTIRGDYAQVYRHITHENRKKSILEVDYIKIF